MSLATGDKLGPYEIVAQIGAGGMGEVYRARDSRLGRDVAIKVSGERFSERFEREARTIAALNHPHICQIYDVGALPTGAGYIVMELVEGETLKGPLPLDTAVKYATQIADALEAAHEKGIVHRDLKPGNIKITPAGSVKVLDFGLAKQSPGPASSLNENSPTLSMGMTQAGVILGTAAYMSPEQARGEPVDKRADIWSFGVVFFEMLAGQRMYEGKTVSDVLAAVLVKEPDLTKVQPQVRKLLRRCLEKDPRNRLRDIADAMPLLEEEGAISGMPAPSRPGGARLAWILAIAMTAIAGVALWEWLRPTPPAVKPVTQFSLTLPVSANVGGTPALSRDGSMLAVTGQNEPGKPIYLRRMDQLEARPVPGTEGATSAAFSPDGQWIAYVSGGDQRSLKKIPVAGGAALTLVDGLNGIPDLDWGLDDNIYYTSLTELLRIPSNGGKPQVLLTADPKKDELQFGAPQLLPGGKVVQFGVLGPKGLNLGRITALNLQTAEKKTVVEGSLRARYAPAGANPDSGYMVYGLNGALLAAPFEVNGLKVGAPRPVLEGVAGIGPLAEFYFSDSGTLAYVPGAVGDLNSLGSTTVLWVDRQGKEQLVPVPPRIYSPADLQLSPENGRVAQAAIDLQRLITDVWVYDLAHGNQPRITFEGSNGNPVWTPDGKRLIYAFSHDLLGQQNPELRSVAADSSAPPTTLLTSEAPGYIPYSVSPDGKLLMGIRSKAGAPNPGPAAGNQIWILPLDSPNAKPTPFLESQFAKQNPQFSPDGKSVVYQANDSGRDEIYVVPYPGPGGKQQVSTDGGTAPRWSHDGKELFYRSGNKMMTVDVQNNPFRVTGTPKMLFEKPGGYDVSRDGKRFLMVRQGAPAGGSNQINIVLNWFEELRRRAAQIK